MAGLVQVQGPGAREQALRLAEPPQPINRAYWAPSSNNKRSICHPRELLDQRCATLGITPPWDRSREEEAKFMHLCWRAAKVWVRKAGREVAALGSGIAGARAARQRWRLSLSHTPLLWKF